LAKIENYVWDKKELPQQTESVFVTVNEKYDENDCSTYSDVVKGKGKVSRLQARLWPRGCVEV